MNKLFFGDNLDVLREKISDMAALDLGTDAMSVLIWVGGAMAALIVAAAVVVWRHRQLSIRALAAGLALTLAGGAGLLILLDQFRPEKGLAERQTVAQRADELASRALNSPLACLDAPAQPMVETACEALLFGRPETIATAVSYVAAKLALLADGVALAGADFAQGGNALAALRRELKADRFGIVAHVLAANSACDADRCEAFALVADANRIKMNMRQNTFDRLVARHAKAWPLGELPKGPAAAVALPRAVGKPLSPGQDFLSAASMPPRSPPLPRPAPRSSSGAVSSALQRAAAPAARSRNPTDGAGPM
jgi:hypothetical protein